VSSITAARTVDPSVEPASIEVSGEERQVSESPSVPEAPEVPEVTVWRAAPPARLAAYAGMVVIGLLVYLVWTRYGLTATIAIVFGVAIIFFLWWGVIRPKLIAGPDGVEAVLGRTPVTVAWRDIRRAVAGPTGLKITVVGGTEVLSRWPQRDRGAKLTDVTEADRVAAFLVQRAEWARRPKGPEPQFVPAPPPARKP
jgi:hypothetical protein